MLEVLQQYGLVAPSVSGTLSLIAAVIIISRWLRNRLPEVLCWGLGLFFQGIWFLMEFGLHLNVIARSPYSILFMQTLNALMIAAFFYGCVHVLTRRRRYTHILTILALTAQMVLFICTDFLLYDYQLGGTVFVFAFAVPFYTFFAVFFFVDFRSSARVASLLIAIYWVILAAAMLLFVIWLFTPYELVFHVIESFNMALMLIGVVLLARSATKRAVKTKSAAIRG